MKNQDYFKNVINKFTTNFILNLLIIFCFFTILLIIPCLHALIESKNQEITFIDFIQLIKKNLFKGINITKNIAIFSLLLVIIFGILIRIPYTFIITMFLGYFAISLILIYAIYSFYYEKNIFKNSFKYFVLKPFSFIRSLLLILFFIVINFNIPIFYLFLTIYVLKYIVSNILKHKNIFDLLVGET